MTTDRRPLALPLTVFLLIAFGLSWLLATPLWLGDGLDHPLFMPITLAMMATPAIAALVVVFFVERPEHRARALGLWPLRPAGRLVGYLALGLVVPVVLVLAALPVGAAIGVYPADFTHFSAFREQVEAQLEAAGATGPQIPIGVLVAVQFVNVVIGAFVNLVPALGEELGWRGWLLPRLQRFGTAAALLVSGVIWGLWHAPLILLGYNYPTAPPWLGLLMMTGFCVVLGAVFGWLRLRSGSVWPAALAHGSLNAAAGFSLVFAQAGETIDTTRATILGWSGWIVPLLLVAVLFATGQFRPAPAEPTGVSGRPAS
ncbi:CPBP family intramembrane metalloprotease [Thermobifida halotolerans]|uniref:CPBP family intramembrane metalloprotease n=1 Tax=Thermobifida halotolerans TaxID=483545 RepID=A0A399G9C9_9ACTN|nr:CPBP family intramembrane glutamic endopeptidase [Thermobifida halotolerans]UOE20601.1 CPBP family intramembrane metalloprotease [Thermobifida halotolerans]